MFVGDDGPIPPPLHIENEAIFLPAFNYLGSLLSYDNQLLPELNRRRGHDRVGHEDNSQTNVATSCDISECQLTDL